MLIGYARVSTTDQEPQLQLDALAAAGCDRVFTDHGISGAAVVKPELEKAKQLIRPGVDSLVVWKLDRLGRSIRDLIDTVAEFERLGIGFRSLTEAVIDTTTPSGKLIFHVFSALAEYERGIIHECTRAGLAAARAKGSKFGRPSKIDDKRWATAQQVMRDNPETKVAALATLLGVSRQAVYRRIELERHRAAAPGTLPAPTLQRAGIPGERP